jgi:hypothetical protein
MKFDNAHLQRSNLINGMFLDFEVRGERINPVVIAFRGVRRREIVLCNKVDHRARSIQIVSPEMCDGWRLGCVAHNQWYKLSVGMSVVDQPRWAVDKILRRLFPGGFIPENVMKRLSCIHV